MKNFRGLLAGTLGALALLLLFVLSTSDVFTNPQNQLAQIIKIETELLKAWQQRGALTKNLSLGATGDSVTLLQRMLSQDPALLSKQNITGTYGPATAEAVQKFQKEYGLTESGAVDAATRKKLNEIFLAYLCPTQRGSDEPLLRKVIRKQPLSLTYVPQGLEEVSKKIRSAGIMCLRSDVVPHIERMFAAAKKEKVELMITSAYRSPDIQQYLYDYWLRLYGPGVLNEIASPGVSEHQLGTTVDLSDKSIGYASVEPKFAKSSGGKWLKQHAHEYGFTMSFPAGKEHVTGFSYEPWHWRYVGVDVATKLHDNGQAFNEVY